VARDGRHALRRLFRDWPFSTAAVVILGLGIVANTAIFSLIDVALLRTPLLAEPDMSTVGLAAASVPAWRAATMDPLKTLRHD